MLQILSYNLGLDLTGGADTFSSRTETRFSCGEPGNTVFADLQAVSVRGAVLNSADLDITQTYQPGRLQLPLLAAENTLIVEADFSYISAGAGLHRVTGPDRHACVYSKAYPGGAPFIWCCFDQPDLRAPFTVSVTAPAGWSCMANGPIVSRPASGDAGLWKFAPTPPIAPYLFSLCAGPFSGHAFLYERDGHSPVPVTANALPSAAAALEAVAIPELFAPPLSYYERSLGTPYPYAKCDVVFVPGYPGLAFGAPGLITVKEQVLTGAGNDSSGLYLATVIAHELAHAWFGGLIQLQSPRDGWLEEAIATYISRAALEETRPGSKLWAPSVSQGLPDHAYASNAGTIRRLEELIGRQAVLAGLGDVVRGHAHGYAARDDLVHCWSQAGGRDLRQWAADTLTPAAENESRGVP